MRHFLTICVFALMSSGQAQLPTYVPTEDLVAWYPFDGDGVDASGANHLTPYGVTHGLNRLGVPDGAVYFDGVDDYLLSQGLTGLEATSSYSFCFWINKANALEDPALVVSQWEGAPEQNKSLHIGYRLAGQSGCASGGCFFQDTFANNLQTGPQPVDDNWRHYVLTYDQGTQRRTIWLNGELLVEDSNGGWESNFSSGLLVGAQKYSTGWTEAWFEGALDELGVWSRALSEDEIELLFAAPLPSGCRYPEACNYDPAALVDDGSCELGTCQCLEGTVWSDDLGGCVVANPSDTDFDGCVGMIDLLDLLSVFGTCAEVPWECEDPLEYQGYDYETVQIGEQCWFAENLRSANYRNGDAILGDLNSDEWAETTLGASSVYDNDDSFTSIYGLHYNGYAVFDERGLCPAGWKISSWEEFYVLADHVGGQEVGCIPLKATSGWTTSPVDLNGTDEYGFAGLPSGYRSASGEYSVVHSGYWSSSVQGTSGVWNWGLGEHEYIYVGYGSMNAGLSVRCLQDAE